MKKLLTALLATAMLLGLASCSKPAEPSGTSASHPPTGSPSPGPCGGAAPPPPTDPPAALSPPDSLSPPPPPLLITPPAPSP